MKVKIGTTLEPSLYERVVRYAKKNGLRVNEVFEEALRAYLVSDNSADFVAESFGAYQVSDEAFESIVENDLYETW